MCPCSPTPPPPPLPRFLKVVSVREVLARPLRLRIYAHHQEVHVLSERAASPPLHLESCGPAPASPGVEEVKDDGLPSKRGEVDYRVGRGRVVYVASCCVELGERPVDRGLHCCDQDERERRERGKLGERDCVSFCSCFAACRRLIKLLQNYLNVLEKLIQLISLYLLSSPTDRLLHTHSVCPQRKRKRHTFETIHRSSPSIPTLAENGSRGAHDGVERGGR